MVAWEKCQELLGVHLKLPHTTAMVMATKVGLLKEKGALQICGDYRWLNKHTERDNYPMHYPEEIVSKSEETRGFCMLDLRQRFNKIPLKSKDKSTTAFHGPVSLYQWTMMPFRLRIWVASNPLLRTGSGRGSYHNAVSKGGGA